VPLIVSLVLLFSSPEIICSLGSDSSSYNAYEDQRPTGDAMELVRRASATLTPVCSPNCATITVFRNTSAPNAILTLEFGRLKLAYAPQFFTGLSEKYGDGAIIAIIAHMLGHAMDATIGARWIKNSWTPELRAEAWAGCALAKANLKATEMESALAALSANPPASRPKWSQRLTALRQGYAQCGGKAFPQ
jgi:hypothetical protein